MTSPRDAAAAPPVEITLSMPWERRVTVSVSVQDQPILQELGTPPPRAPRADEWRLILSALSRAELPTS